MGKAENTSAEEMRTKLTNCLKEKYKESNLIKQEFKLNGENIDNYISKMKKPTEYGTHLEIYIYSLVYKKRVIIYIIDENGKGKGLINNIGEENTEITYLLFITPNENNSKVGHYNLLVKN